MKIAILAAGVGSRLGSPRPKPLTLLRNGSTIMQQQMDHLNDAFPGTDIFVVVGFKMDVIMEEFPEVAYLYNQDFGETNTSKSLLKALRFAGGSGVLWLNGDVVFERGILEEIRPHLEADETFVCVNTAAVGEEEVKYSVDGDGYVAALSKTVENGLGEAVGINYVAGDAVPTLLRRLEECAPQDYFEAGIETAIAKDGLRVRALDISAYGVVEVDFREDLEAAGDVGRA